MLAVYDTRTATSSTKKDDGIESAMVVAMKVSVTVCPAYLDSILVALKVTCCQLWVASVLQALCTLPIALPLLSNNSTVKVSLQLLEVRLVSPYHQ